MRVLCSALALYSAIACVGCAATAIALGVIKSQRWAKGKNDAVTLDKLSRAFGWSTLSMLVIFVVAVFCLAIHLIAEFLGASKETTGAAIYFSLGTMIVASYLALAKWGGR